MIETSEVLLISRTQVLMNAGTERRTACGTTTMPRISGRRMPRLRAASHCARGSASIAGAEDFRHEGAEIDRHHEDAARNRREVDAGVGQPVVHEEQQQQQRYAAHDVDIDIDGDAQRPPPERAQQRRDNADRAAEEAPWRADKLERPLRALQQQPEIA